EDEIRSVRTREVERLEPVARAHGLIAAGLDEVAEELHVELVVLDDHNLLGHASPSFLPRPWPGQEPRRRHYPHLIDETEIGGGELSTRRISPVSGDRLAASRSRMYRKRDDRCKDRGMKDGKAEREAAERL